MKLPYNQNGNLLITHPIAIPYNPGNKAEVDIMVNNDMMIIIPATIVAIAAEISW
jgi:hypothetical protein